MFFIFVTSLITCGPSLQLFTLTSADFDRLTLALDSVQNRSTAGMPQKLGHSLRHFVPRNLCHQHILAL
jgi:hypothetical protein